MQPCHHASLCNGCSSLCVPKFEEKTKKLRLLVGSLCSPSLVFNFLKCKRLFLILFKLQFLFLPYQQNQKDKKVDVIEPKKKFENVCQFYKNGHCRFGKDCRKDHPKFCQKFIHNGHQKFGNKGCDGKCEKLHPNACRDSLKKRECSRDKCKFFHIKGTTKTEYKPNSQNSGEQSQLSSNFQSPTATQVPTQSAIPAQSPVFQGGQTEIVMMLRVMMEEMRSWRTNPVSQIQPALRPQSQINQ